jgi:hypothetical protein
MIENHLRHVGAGLNIPAALQLEDITFRAEDRTPLETLEQTRFWLRITEHRSLHVADYSIR